MSELIIIAAHCEENKVIGNKGLLPWHYKEDLNRFKELTLNHTLIMGRTTFDSVGVLPNRKTIVISNSIIPGIYSKKGKLYEVKNNLYQAIEESLLQDNKVFIAGGASIYKQSLHLATCLELTIIKGAYTGDTFFPNYEHLLDSTFTLIKKEEQSHLTYVTYIK